MAESVIFLLITGMALIGVIYAFDITWVDPRFFLIALTALIIPGIYAAITGGPFVPSARKRHRTMMKLAQLDSEDIVCDLGCGDGRFIFTAAPHVKKAIGYELSIPLVLWGKMISVFRSKKAHIRFGDIWKQDYKKATVIFIYLLPKSMKRFHEEVWPNLTPGTRVISNAFQIHDLKPHKEEEKVYLYRV